MRLLTHKEIDFKKWDRAILNSPSPLVFAQSFWLNATAPGWSALIEGNYDCLMPLTQKKKLGMTYLMQPPFTPQLGVFGDCAESEDMFISYLEEHFRYIAIELNFSSRAKTHVKEKKTYIINYAEPFEFNSNTKRNIAKALKAGLQITELKKNETLELSRKHLHPFLKKKLSLSIEHIRLFEDLVENGIEEKHLKTWVARDQKNELLALAHFVSNGKHAVYLKGMNEDKEHGAMHLLMSHAIEHFKKERNSFFDFGGGQSESLARFYSGFGAKPLVYKEYKLNRLPKAIRWMKK